MSQNLINERNAMLNSLINDDQGIILLIFIEEVNGSSR